MEPQPHLHLSAEHRVAEHTAADTAADTEVVRREPEDKALPAAADTDLEVVEDTDPAAVQDTDPAVVQDIDPAVVDIGPEAEEDIGPEAARDIGPAVEERHPAVLRKNWEEAVNSAPAKEPWFHRTGGSDS